MNAPFSEEYWKACKTELKTLEDDTDTSRLWLKEHVACTSFQLPWPSSSRDFLLFTPRNSKLDFCTRGSKDRWSWFFLNLDTGSTVASHINTNNSGSQREINPSTLWYHWNLCLCKDVSRRRCLSVPTIWFQPRTTMCFLAESILVWDAQKSKYFFSISQYDQKDKAPYLHIWTLAFLWVTRWSQPCRLMIS